MALASAVDIMSILANLAKVALLPGEEVPTSYGEFYRKTERSTMLGTITNLSTRKFAVQQFTPEDGKWTTKLPTTTARVKFPVELPTHGVSGGSFDVPALNDILHKGVKHVLRKVSDETKAKLAHDLGPNATNIQTARWISNQSNFLHLGEFLNLDVNHCIMLMGCKGKGVGSEVAILLTDIEEPDRKLVLMIRHIPGGKTGREYL